MEKRINKKIETYVTTLKESVHKKITELSFSEKDKTSELIEYIYEYQRLTIQKEDLIKRKRIKNSIPNLNRCIAKRANDEQCTRRRKEGCEYCGTHVKVFAEEIFGIVYYIDKQNNVYKTEDILEGKENPKIIAKCLKQNGILTIPELGLV